MHMTCAPSLSSTTSLTLRSSRSTSGRRVHSACSRCRTAVPCGSSPRRTFGLTRCAARGRSWGRQEAGEAVWRAGLPAAAMCRPSGQTTARHSQPTTRRRLTGSEAEQRGRQLGQLLCIPPIRVNVCAVQACRCGGKGQVRPGGNMRERGAGPCRPQHACAPGMFHPPGSAPRKPPLGSRVGTMPSSCGSRRLHRLHRRSSWRSVALPSRMACSSSMNSTSDWRCTCGRAARAAHRQADKLWRDGCGCARQQKCRGIARAEQCNNFARAPASAQPRAGPACARHRSGNTACGTWQ